MAQLTEPPGGWLAGNRHRVNTLEDGTPVYCDGMHVTYGCAVIPAFTTDTEPGGSPGTNEGIDQMDGSMAPTPRLAVADEYPGQFEQVHNIATRELGDLQDWIEVQQVTELRAVLNMADRVAEEHMRRATEARTLENIVREQLSAASHHNEVQAVGIRAGHTPGSLAAG